MKKRIKLFCLACIAVLCLPMVVCAEETTPKATFDGTTEIKYKAL